jgi:glycosyltransferase involved in cell wall biosynthesis
VPVKLTESNKMRRSSSERFLKVLVLANKDWGIAPNQRYRFEQWAPWLERNHNIQIDLLPFESPRLSKLLYEEGRIAEKALLIVYDFVRRAKAVLEAQRYDVVVISREASLIGPAIYERLVAWSGKPLVFDFDDSIWSPSQAHSNGFYSHLHFYRKTSAICRLARAVTVGNEYLAGYARKRNSNVWIVPSSIELRDYILRPEPAAEVPFTVCWTGSNSTLRHFERARPALETLARQVQLKVRVICDRPPNTPITGAETEFVRWSAQSEADDLSQCHVGIMPLPDDEISRGKCGMKALQYMAAGRPVVASPVGVNIDIVRDGETGFLATFSDQFVKALFRLAEQPDLRCRLGAKGRQAVERHYSAEAVSQRFAAAIRSALP